jgi:integrase
MSNTTINRCLERMGYAGQFSGHGFRATASTLLNEMAYRPDLIERQLAHKERNRVRASYNQAEYIKERTEMMQHWSNFIDNLMKGDNVLPIRSEMRIG